MIQFDPPSNAEAFVHRCGRTARSGSEGQALVFLLPSEKAYVDFIGLNQKVELKALELPPLTQSNLLPILRDWQKNDRSVFDLANRAFVSHVQAYSKHECKYILRLKGKKLALEFLANGYQTEGIFDISQENRNDETDKKSTKVTKIDKGYKV